MADAHPTLAMFEEYLEGVLGNPGAFEEHVRECEPCAKRLQFEAHVDMAMFEAAEAVEHRTGAPKVAPQPKTRTFWRGPWRPMLLWGGLSTIGVIVYLRMTPPDTHKPDQGFVTVSNEPSEPPDFDRFEARYYPRYPDGHDRPQGLTEGDRK